MICKICAGRTVVTHRGQLLGRYPVDYHLCTSCQFWCTDEPSWLAEAYDTPIGATDTGLVQRNLGLASRLPAVLEVFFPAGPYVDWAGGCGMLVRLMRDRGFEFYWQDRYAQNLLAAGFEWDAAARAGRRAAAVTAIEVLEHAPDPLALLDDCLRATGAGAVLFTQELHTGGDDPDWWYLTPVTGQHVSFFSRRTLTVLAHRLGLHVTSALGLHLLTRTRLSRRRLTRARLRARLPSGWVPSHRVALTWPDHLAVTSRLRDATSDRPIG